MPANSIDAGKLNRRITIQRRDGSTGRYGDPAAEGWTDVCTVWAAVTATGAREFWAAYEAHAELTHRVTIRYRDGITADMRIVLGDPEDAHARILDIAAPPVDYDEAHRYLVLKCREVTT